MDRAALDVASNQRRLAPLYAWMAIECREWSSHGLLPQEKTELFRRRYRGTTLFGYAGRFGVTGGFFFNSAINTSTAFSSCGS